MEDCVWINHHSTNTPNSYYDTITMFDLEDNHPNRKLDYTVDSTFQVDLLVTKPVVGRDTAPR